MAKAKSAITRSGTRRLGDEYQDAVAVNLLVDWLRHRERYVWIRFEADEAGALDDVVALHPDGRVTAFQVKYSTNPELPDDALTWDMLLHQKSASSTSWLQKWFESYFRLRGAHQVVDASLVTNRRASAEVGAVLTQEGRIDFDRIPEPTRSHVISHLGDEARVRQFFTEFRFSLNEPSLRDLDDAAQRKFHERGGSDNGWLNLKYEVGQWVCYHQLPPPNGEITLAEVKRAARWHQLDGLLQSFEMPPDFVLPNVEFHAELVARLQSGHEPRCLFLCASPGAGKSTYASNLFEHLSRNDVPVVRHHYFVSANDQDLYFRLEHQRAAESLMHDLQRDHSHTLGNYGDNNPNPTGDELRKWLTASGASYAAEHKTLVLILDGLDHVWREKQSVEELDSLLKLLLPAPAGVFILLVSQPVDDTQLPSQLSRFAPREQWQWLPPFDVEATRTWLGFHVDELKSIGEPLKQGDPRIGELAVALHERSGGNPLHLRYTVRAALEQGRVFDEETIQGLPNYPHDGIRAYYELLWTALGEPSRHVLCLIAATDFAWPRAGLLDCLDPGGVNRPSHTMALRLVEHLLRDDDLGLRPYHGSLVAFVRDREEYKRSEQELRRKALVWLSSPTAPDYLRWGQVWLLAADLGDVDHLLNGPDRAWVVQAIAHGRPPEAVEHILTRAIRLALSRNQLNRVIRLSLLAGYYRRVQDGDEGDTLNLLLFAQLMNDSSREFRPVLRSRLAELSGSQIELLAEADCRAGETAHAARYDQQARDRLWGYRPSNRLRRAQADDINPLIRVLADLGEDSGEQAIGLAIANRKNGYAQHILNVYAERLRSRAAVGRFRDVIAATARGYGPTQSEFLSAEERAELIHPFILSALEEGWNCDAVVRENSAYPASQIYAAIRQVTNFQPPELPPPQLEGLAGKGYDRQERRKEGADAFVALFYSALANSLWGRTAQTQTWVAELETPPWATRFAEHLVRIAGQVGEDLQAGRRISVPSFFSALSTLPRPEFRGNENWDEHSHGIAAGRAAVRIGFDLKVLGDAASQILPLEAEDLERMLRSGYCDRPLWMDELVRRRRPMLSSGALDWLIATATSELDTTADHFSSRASIFANLAAVCAIHGRADDTTRLVLRASENLLAYGYHKDMLFYHVIEAVRAYHGGCASKSQSREVCTKWLCAMAPAIANLDAYTDGDETNHFPVELATAMGEICPELLPPYYAWLVRQEEYYDAERVFREYLLVADLNDPVERAVALTAVDRGALDSLVERQRKGDASAGDVMLVITDSFGPGVLTNDDDHDRPTPASQERLESPPNPDQYLPTQLAEYLTALRDAHIFSPEPAIAGWIDHWCRQGRHEQVYAAIRPHASGRSRDWPFDRIYQLAKEVEGRQTAYQWLELAQKRENGWSRYFVSESRQLPRWQTVKSEHHPRRTDFLCNI